MQKLRPKCFHNEIQTSLTNRGHLIPCCNVDQPETLEDPMMVKMLKVSNVADYDTIDEILLTDEWQEFAKNLEQRNLEKIMPVCIIHCAKRKGRDRQKIETYTLGKLTREVKA